MNRLGCSTGSLGCVIDIVFIAPSFSCHSSSLHTKTFYLFLEQFIYFAVFKQSENRGKQSKWGFEPGNCNQIDSVNEFSSQSRFPWRDLRERFQLWALNDEESECL